MVRIELAHRFDVDRETAFDYITDPANWPAYWPGLVGRPELDGSGWRTPGAVARLRMRLGGRRTELTMTLDEWVRPERVYYGSVQPGLAPARHERHFEPAPVGFVYRLVVSYAPRSGGAGLLDRTLVRWAIRRALGQTVAALDQRLPGAARARVEPTSSG
jgi:hypothetical protein